MSAFDVTLLVTGLYTGFLTYRYYHGLTFDIEEMSFLALWVFLGGGGLVFLFWSVYLLSFVPVVE